MKKIFLYIVVLATIVVLQAKDIKSNILTCTDNGRTYRYLFNSNAKLYSGTYHLMTNEQSTLVLSNSGEGNEFVYKLKAFGRETKEKDYDIKVISWGVAIDDNNNIIRPKTNSYILIRATNDINHKCSANVATIFNGTASFGYWIDKNHGNK